MNGKARLALPIALFFFHQFAWADGTLNKCTDGKEITYTDKPCEKLGLTSAGPINRETVTIVPATRFTAAPKNTRAEEEKQSDSQPASATEESDAYQCTSYFGTVSFSSSPCTGASFVPQLKAYVPAKQETVSHKQACETLSDDPDIKSRSNLTCP